MKSATLPSFWAAYKALDETIRRRARKAYHLWAENPFHPSLRFKCINREEDIWALRITRGYRAMRILEGDTVTWFWNGGHDEYELNGQEVTQEAMEVLFEHLSPAKVARLLAAWRVGRGNYLAIRDQLFADETATTLFEKVQAHQRTSGNQYITCNPCDFDWQPATTR